MKILYEVDKVIVRRMEDDPAEYALLAKWLSDPVVLDCFEGRNHSYTYEKVIEKFRSRVIGEDKTVACMICYEREMIGYIQYFPTNDREYEIDSVVSTGYYKRVFAMDIFIGEPAYWNKGLGTHVIQGMNRYLMQQLDADLILIDPMTWNKRAIRCYEHSGFQFLAVVQSRDEINGELQDSYIMAIRNEAASTEENNQEVAKRVQENIG